MPELPEVETVRRGLQPVLEGSVIEHVELRRPNLRYPFPDGFAEQISGRRINSLGRRAKYLTLHLDGGPVVICHLGMSGSFRVQGDEVCGECAQLHHPFSRNKAHDHVVFHIVAPNGENQLVIFNDPRRFGFMLLTEESTWHEHPMLVSLGVEPTGNRLDGNLVSDLFRNRTAPLKAALLDQRLIAGLGNIYVCEALWRAGLSPRRSAKTVSSELEEGAGLADRLAVAIRGTIAEAIAAGGSSLRDHARTDGSLGLFQHSFNVYDREGQTCRRLGCPGTIQRFVQNGRSTFFCPACQL